MKSETVKAREGYPQLVVRKIDFELEQDIDPVWNPAKPEWSHMFTGASLTMPYLEPFLIRTMREASKLVTDPALLEEMRDFNAQEAQHYQHHAKYNAMIKGSGYPELQAVEDRMAAEYKGFKKHSLKWRLAYTAGFETMTMGVTEWLVNDRRYLFGDSQSKVASFVLWHMVEETEHKNVAIDAYHHLYPKAYFSRIWGLLRGSAHVALTSRKAYIVMLKKDGRWRQWSSRLAVWKMVAQFLLKASPAMLRALVPGYHPSKVRDPEWVEQWVNAFSVLPEGYVPILDTENPDIPPTFTSAPVSA